MHIHKHFQKHVTSLHPHVFGLSCDRQQGVSYGHNPIKYTVVCVLIVKTHQLKHFLSS